MSYKHFTTDERKSLQLLLNENKSFREIAEILGRNVSSISREVARNRSARVTAGNRDNAFHYNGWRAQVLAITRQRQKRHFRLEPGSEEWDYIVSKLKLYWSPEQIAFRWRKDHPDKRPFGVSTVYRYLNNKVFESVSPKNNLRRHHKQFMPRSSNYNSIQPDRLITDWPEEIRNRSRIGDWEGDTVYGGVGKGLLITLVDRRTRLLKAALLPSRNAELTGKLIVSTLKDLPVRSLSFDNGSEFSEFRKIEEDLKTKVYFAEPHKPWQRGTNENTNDIIRFFFKKGFDFRSISQDDVDFVVDLINNRPRKTLNWLSPIEFFMNSVALT